MSDDVSSAIEELGRRHELEIGWDPQSFLTDGQKQVFNSSSPYRCVVAGRRWGKSYGWAAALVNEGFKYAKSVPLFVTTSRQDAREILEPAMDLLNDTFKLGLHQNMATGDYYMPNGSRIALRGAGTMREINKIRGKKYPCAIIDEAQNFGPDLTYLIDEAIEPAVADYHGWIGISGTPAPAAMGPFWDIAGGKYKDAWEHFHGTFLDNPTMPDPEGFIRRVMDRRGWTEEHPSYQREYMGLWVRDKNAQAFKLDPQRDIVPTFPGDTSGDWDFVMGIDVGYNDPFAFVVIAQSQMLGQAFVVDSYEESELTTMEALVQAERMCAEWPITRIALDTGGAGKLVVKDWEKMSTLPLEAAKKTHKASQVSVINGDLQAGKLKICRDRNLKLINDSMVVEWDPEKVAQGRWEYRRGSMDHLLDALQYGYNLTFHHTFDPEYDTSVKAGSTEYFERAEDKMEKAAIRRLADSDKAEEDIITILQG
jgi:hypothetical protein